MRIVLLSERKVVDPDRCDYGLYHRMGLLIEILKGIGEVGALIVVHHDGPLEMVQRYCSNLSRRWGIRIGCISADRRLGCNPIAQADRGLPVDVSSLIRDLGDDRAVISEGQVTKYLRTYDVVLAHRIESMRWIAPGESLPPILFDLDDLEHLKLLRTIGEMRGISAKAMLLSEVVRTLILEFRAVRMSTRTFVCSHRDRRALIRSFGLRRVSVIANCVDIKSCHEFQPRRVLLFLGTYLYWPNVQAAEFMITKIWPLVLAMAPEARLVIAGWPPEAISLYGSGPRGVEFAGHVDDLDGLYAGVRAVCCPILVGGGTRIKILEAAAYGKAIVSTTVGAEGLDLQDGIHLLLRDGPEDFAEACVTVLSDDGLCQHLGIEARKRVAEAYDRNLVVEKARDDILSALKSRSGQRCGKSPDSGHGRAS